MKPPRSVIDHTAFGDDVNGINREKQAESSNTVNESGHGDGL